MYYTSTYSVISHVMHTVHTGLVPFPDHFWLVLGDTEYQVSLLLIPGSRMVVLSTEIGVVRYQILPHGNMA